MWFERFWQLIDRSAIGKAVEKRRRLLHYTGEPQRIYIENVRSFFGVSYRIAKGLCELGVREGLLDRCEAVLCPHDQRVLLDLCAGDDEGSFEITCKVCEGLEIEPSSFAVQDCKRLVFYRLRHADA